VHDDDGVRTTLFVATLRAEQLLRIVLEDGAPRAAQIEVVFDGLGRLRAADFGPDGCLYLTTSNTDGRGQPRPGDDRVLRLCPR
jgi:glucose/arabinose dehydrogenase